MFSNEQKIFIVQAFGRHSSPTKVRQEFLKHYAIKKGRPTFMYRLNQFVKDVSIFYKVDQLHQPQREEGRRRGLMQELKKLGALSLKITLLPFGKYRRILHQASLPYGKYFAMMSTSSFIE